MKAESNTQSQSVKEALRRHELLKVLAIAKDKLQLQPLFFKGTALAYTVYDKPWERERFDHDILLPMDQVEKFAALLLSLGYQEHIQLSIFNERCFYKMDSFGLQHVWDVHWRISNRSLISDLFTYDELLDRSCETKIQSLTQSLIQSLRSISLIDQVLLIALHEIFHHRSEFLITSLQDGKKIFGVLSSAQTDNLIQLATEKKITSVLSFYLERINQQFPNQTIELNFDVVNNQRIDSWILRPPGIAKILLLDLYYTKGVFKKINFLKGLLIPSRQYLKHHHQSRSFRLCRGVRELFFFLIPIRQSKKVR